MKNLPTSIISSAIVKLLERVWTSASIADFRDKPAVVFGQREFTLDLKRLNRSNSKRRVEFIVVRLCSENAPFSTSLRKFLQTLPHTL